MVFLMRGRLEMWKWLKLALVGLMLAAPVGQIMAADLEVVNIAGYGVTTSAKSDIPLLTFGYHTDFAFDSNNNMYVVDALDNVIRKISADGKSSVLAGGEEGNADGKGSLAMFYHPTAIQYDPAGFLYVVDSLNHRICKVSLDGDVSTFVTTNAQPWGMDLDSSGNLYVTFPSALQNGGIAKIDKQGKLEIVPINKNKLNLSVDIEIADNGLLYILDAWDSGIYSLNQKGDLTTLAGNAEVGYSDGSYGGAKFDEPYKMEMDKDGNLLVADVGNCRIRKVTPNGVVTTVLGDGTRKFSPGSKANAQVGYVYALHFDNLGNLYFSTDSPNIIAKWDTNDMVSAVYGAGENGFSVGEPLPIQDPIGVVADQQGNTYVSEGRQNRIKKIAKDGTMSIFAGSGVAGFADGTGKQAKFNCPQGLAIDNSGNIYVADTYNHRIRKITPAGVITTIAGTSFSGYMDGAAAKAQFNFPAGIAIDTSGNLYIADSGNNMIRKLTIANATVTTLAGSRMFGYADGTGMQAQFFLPTGIDIDSNNNLYVVELFNHAVRKVTMAGVVTTFAGDREAGYVDGDAAAARFDGPYDLAVDKVTNNVYVSDMHNHAIRLINQSGQVTTFAGNGKPGGLGGPIATAQFNNPDGIALDAKGNLIIADNGNNLVRKIMAPIVNVTGISLNTSTLAMHPGDEANVDETVTPDNADDKTVTWTSSAPSVATVDASGKIVAIAAGTAEITATTNNGNKTAKVNVNVEVIPNYKVNKLVLNLLTGESETLTVTRVPSSPMLPNLSWTSLNTDIAKVDSNGKVTAVANGTTLVSVKPPDGPVMSVVVNVTTKVTGVTISGATSPAKLKLGSNLQLIASVAPSTASNTKKTWTSSKPDVASVDQSGKVTAKTKGTTRITVTTADGSKTAFVDLTVTVPVKTLSFDSDITYAKPGTTTALKVTINPNNADDKTLRWTSSNPQVATVDAKGNVKAISKGTTKITVTAENGTVIATTFVQVVVYVSSLQIDSTKTIKVGQTAPIGAQIYPVNATQKAINWVSSNPKVAKVDNNGVVKGISAGSATITATTVDGGFKDTCSVTIIK
jgi:uncharacterized protein YjdB